jgi:hypothetical protein
MRFLAAIQPSDNEQVSDIIGRAFLATVQCRDQEGLLVIIVNVKFYPIHIASDDPTELDTLARVDFGIIDPKIHQATKFGRG